MKKDWRIKAQRNRSVECIQLTWSTKIAIGLLDSRSKDSLARSAGRSVRARRGARGGNKVLISKLGTDTGNREGAVLVQERLLWSLKWPRKLGGTHLVGSNLSTSCGTASSRAFGRHHFACDATAMRGLTD